MAMGWDFILNPSQDIRVTFTLSDSVVPTGFYLTQWDTISGGEIYFSSTYFLCESAPVRIAGTSSEFNYLQDAYDAAVNDDIIKSRERVFNEGQAHLYIDRNISVTLKSGYACDYTNNDGKTILNGNMTISDGKLTIESGTFVVM
jgi:hypothetical protein